MITDKLKKMIETTMNYDGDLTEVEKQKIRQTLSNADLKPVKMITAKKACEMLDCTRRTLHNWEMAGKIKATRQSKRHVRFNLADVEALMVNGIAQ